MMMSGPLPDWIDEVTRAWMSLALIVSKRILMPRAFSPAGRIFFPQEVVGGRHEIGPTHPVDAGRLRVSGRPPRRQDPGEAAARCRNGSGAGEFQKPAPVDARHHLSSLA